MLNNYLLKYCPDHPFVSKSKMMPVHRLVVEKHIGRYLTNAEVVHHINEDKTDNRIKNLAIMTKSEHRKLHMVNPHNKGVKKHSDKIYNVLSLRKSGLFCYEIAQKLNIPRRTISRYLKNAGLGNVVSRQRNAQGQFI